MLDRFRQWLERRKQDLPVLRERRICKTCYTSKGAEQMLAQSIDRFSQTIIQARRVGK